MILIVILIAILYIYILFSGDFTENFNSSDKIYIRTSSNLYGNICGNTNSLCFGSNKIPFTILKFSDNIIGLQNNLKYISACMINPYIKTCNDSISVNNFNPNSTNAKLVLVPNSDSSYFIQFYDGKYLSIGTGNVGIKTYLKNNAIKVFLDPVN